jgi:dTDP-4-amino-4,6-dideoxygalactose transaminase
MKTTWRDLAVMGASPEFAEPVLVGSPNVGDKAAFSRRMEEIFASRRFSNHGPFVREFEARIAEIAGVRHCVATCNATLGLELVIEALGITGSAIVPSFTFIATAHALERCGVTPIFCDVDPATHNIDPTLIARLIRKDTSAILGVHLWGRPCPVDALAKIAAESKLRLLFDAAHAFGASHDELAIGGFGDAEVFSFHATKAINSFEGGAITTNDDQLADRLREMVNFGTAPDGRVVRSGTNAKLSEPCAAMGLTSIEAKDMIFAHNRANHQAYRQGLSGVAGLALLPYPESESPNFQYAVVEVDARNFGLSRDELVRLLKAENVLAQRYFHPGCHRSEPYLSRRDGSEAVLPVTERLCDSVICLPTGLAVTADDIARICRIIELAARPAPELKARLVR